MTGIEDAIQAERDEAVLRYRNDVITPALKKLLEQCVDIEEQLVLERSAACCCFRDLRLDIERLLSQQGGDDE